MRLTMQDDRQQCDKLHFVADCTNGRAYYASVASVCRRLSVRNVLTTVHPSAKVAIDSL